MSRASGTEETASMNGTAGTEETASAGRTVGTEATASAGRTVVIGAGKTGRGFIGRLLAEAGLPILFVDINEALVRSLNETRSYKVHFFGGERKSVTVAGYQAATWENCDLSGAELLFVSVGGTNLGAVGEALKRRLSPRKPCYVIACENAASPADVLREAIALPNVHVSEATVFCTTVQENGNDIGSENYPYLQFDAARLNGYVPKIPSVKPIENFGNFLTRKLFTYNAASCIIAYMGWFYGYGDYGAAANDPRILAMLDQNYAVTNRVLCRKFGYDPLEQAEFALLSKRKFCDRTITDTIARNAREPQRKLGPNERVIGPMKLMEEYGEDSSVLEKTAAVMLFYDNAQETEWREIRSRTAPEAILTGICGLSRDSRLFNRILEQYVEMKALYQAGRTQ